MKSLTQRLWLFQRKPSTQNRPLCVVRRWRERRRTPLQADRSVSSPPEGWWTARSERWMCAWGRIHASGAHLCCPETAEDIQMSLRIFFPRANRFLIFKYPRAKLKPENCTRTEQALTWQHYEQLMDYSSSDIISLLLDVHQTHTSLGTWKWFKNEN